MMQRGDHWMIFFHFEAEFTKSKFSKKNEKSQIPALAELGPAQFQLVFFSSCVPAVSERQVFQFPLLISGYYFIFHPMSYHQSYESVFARKYLNKPKV